LENENYPHYAGNTLARTADEVLIEEDLLFYLLTKYEHHQLTETEAKSIILQLKTLPASDLYTSNRTIQRWLSDGFILKREDRNQKDIHIQLIDFNGLDTQLVTSNLDTIVAEPLMLYQPRDYNIYKFVNQLEITGNEKRIPDGIIYINGIPVVVFEFKSAIREECTIHDAYTQLTVRYKRDIPELFKYNAFCVISDGVNNKAGSFFAPYEFFYAWRRVAGLAKEVDGIDSMFTLVQGMLNRNRLRDIIRNFIYMPDTPKENEKIVCRYPQYYAAKCLYDSIKSAQKPDGNGKGGTYFGATGCGKSFTMLFLSRLLMKSQHFRSPTLVLITDRTDLDDQLARQFTNAKGFMGLVKRLKAAYDILKSLCIKYDFTYPDNKMIELAKAVKRIVDTQAKYPDWNKRDDIKSALKVDLILLLDEFGYPPVERDEVYVEIFEQAENFKKNRA
jgi:type I restriction enzyme R subunit